MVSINDSLNSSSLFPARVTEIVIDGQRLLQVDIGEPGTLDGGQYSLACRQFYPWNRVISVTPIGHRMFLTMMRNLELQDLPKTVKTLQRSRQKATRSLASWMNGDRNILRYSDLCC
jgi:hypothetical protein